MKQALVLFAFVSLYAGVALAQKGGAETGYYPMGYAGDTWTGEVTSFNEDAREFTLTHKDKTFVGVLVKGYTVKMKDGSDHEVKMAELNGMRLKAYYRAKSKTDANGVKVKFNEVFRIRFLPKEN